MTVRSLQCACGIRDHPLCQWHSSERHLVRLASHSHRRSDGYLPLFPQTDQRTHGDEAHLDQGHTPHAVGLWCGNYLARRFWPRTGGVWWTLPSCRRGTFSSCRWDPSCFDPVAWEMVLKCGGTIPAERSTESCSSTTIGGVTSTRTRLQWPSGGGSALGSAVGPSPSTPAPNVGGSMLASTPMRADVHQFISDPAEGRENRAQPAAQKRLLDQLQAEVLASNLLMKSWWHAHEATWCIGAL